MNKQQIKQILEEEADLDEAIEQILALGKTKVVKTESTLEYQILNFAKTNESEPTWILNSNNGYKNINNFGNWHLERMLYDNSCSVKSNEIKILSVQRFSDDTVFTLGDRVQLAEHPQHEHKGHTSNKITKFELINNQIRLHFACDKCTVLLKNAVKLVTIPNPMPKAITPTYKILCYSQASNRLSHSLTKRDNTWDIHEVERLSDGVKFKIGDKVQHIYSTEDTGIITSFRVDNANLIVEFQGFYKDDNNFNFCNDIKILKILKTEDGVDIYEGDKITIVNTKDFRISNTDIPENHIRGHCRVWDGSDGYLQFSSKQAAEEYIILNKPCLSLMDLKKAGYISASQTLKQLVKSKL